MPQLKDDESISSCVYTSEALKSFFLVITASSDLIKHHRLKKQDKWLNILCDIK